jgi:type III pantothenate kinase
MILTIDVGNSNVVAGLFLGGVLDTSWRFATDRERMPDEWWAIFSELASSEHVDLSSIDGAIISSVVPRLTSKMRDMVRHRVGVQPFVVSTEIDLGIGVHIDHEEAGAHRIVNAAAVRQLYRTPAIVVVFGTPRNFDVVSSDGNYIGGAIAPGVQLALEALTGRAARLSAVELLLPPRAIGSNTVHSVQSGTVLGYLELVSGMLERISTELDEEPVVVATGGLGELFHANVPRIESYEPDLTLYGLNIIYQHLTRI